MRISIAFGLVALLGAGLANAQDAKLSSEELTQMLRGQVGPAYDAGELEAILKPAPVTRGFNASSGPAPGNPGSGVVPDLRVNFEFDSAELTPGARAQLDELGKALVTPELDSYGFEIAGHTDAVGSDTYNAWLSEERAKAVVAYLAGNGGVDASRLQAIGYGESQLFDPANPGNGMNRRVEVRTQR